MGTHLAKNRSLATQNKIMFKFTLLDNCNLKHFLFILTVSQCHYNSYIDIETLNS